MMGFGMMDSFMFSVFPVLFMVAFVVIVSMFIVMAVKGVGEWNRNNHSPRLTVPARVVSRRDRVSSSSAGDHMHHHHHTTYYVTFEVESGDRMEFCVTGREYGLMAEGDMGHLTFQGTRFIAFDRER